MDFELTLRYLYGKPQSDFDALLIHLEDMIDTFERNVEATMTLYGQSYLSEKEKIKNTFRVQWKAANEVYKEAYEEISGDDSEKNAWAAHKANFAYIEGEEQSAEEFVDRNHREMIDHYNKSATAMLYSILEGQFRRFAELLRLLGNHILTVEDLVQKNYLDGIVKYLEKVIGLNVTTIKPYIEKLQPLRLLRNKIMHNNGEFPDIEGTELSKFVKDSNHMLDWEQEFDEAALWTETVDEVKRYYVLRIKNIEFLQPFYKLIREFFNELFWLADEHLNHQPIAERLKYAAGFVGREIRVESTTIIEVDKGKKIKATVINDGEDEPKSFDFSITVTRSSKNKFEVINQVPNADRLDRLAAYIQKNPHIILKSVLQGFNIGNRTTAVNVKFC
ncbi:hypothetical protein ACRQ5D_31375 [Mucilaginibacter sp. P25]|uniref:Uncharacterized protein n=1 Tax=Mucilaginibacter gossypiicola TaxID=551995 RepID=A0A1H8AY93_9SPHI|nr:MULTISPECIES: hypothetical protein [Mucilaginibacter]UOE52234.1 hypothetical protein MTO98_14205 [Mucilaginibacter sp. SMC90]SEM74748.1 hypothetical protein SAMN05192574_101683 [Mucilaginibacter gossypiicola]